MNIKNKKPSGEHKNIRDIIDECQEISRNRNYIFRGTSCLCVLNGNTIQSTLYRQLFQKKLIDPNLDLFKIEIDKVNRARYLFAPNSNNIQILTELRHYGDDLTIIDFTRSLFVALFFACGNTLERVGDNNKSDKGDGEIVMLKMPETKLNIDYDAKSYYAIEPAINNTSYNRIVAQDSIFIHAPDGYIDHNPPNPNTPAIKIESDLKVELLEYLRKYHNIESKSMYRDVFGFIDKEKRSNPFENYRGMLAFEEGDYELALKLFNNVIKKNPHAFSAINSRGAVFAKQNKIDESITEFSKAIELNPSYDIAYFNKGNALIAKGDTMNALSNFEKSLEINPKNKYAYLKRGGIFLYSCNFSEALENANCALAIDPDYGEALRLRVEVNLALSRYIVAQIDLEHFSSLYPNEAKTYSLKGFYYNHKGDVEKSIDEYNKALAVDNKYIFAYIQLALIKFKEKNYEEMIKKLSVAINILMASTEKHPHSLSEALYYRGQAKVNYYQELDGISDFTLALACRPSAPQIYNHRGLAYLIVGSIEENKYNAKEAMRYYNLAIADFSKVIADFSKATRSNSVLSNAYENMAMANKLLSNQKNQKNI